MSDMGQYIILDGKRPTHRFRDGIGAKTWDEVEGCPDVAMIVPDGWLVLDFDDADDAQLMLGIVMGEDLRCRVVKTTRGIHCYFRRREDMENRNAIHSRLAIGLTADKKSGGRNAYVKIRQGGKPRQVLRDVPLDDCQEVPRWLDAVGAPRGQFDFKRMAEGDGRNQELFNYVVYLQSKGFDHDEVRDCLRVVNDYVLADPLPAAELATITRDEAFRPDEEMAPEIAANAAAMGMRGFQHNVFGDELAAEYHIIELDGILYVYDEADGVYRADDRLLEGRMVRELPCIKQRDRNEVLAYLRIKCHVRPETLRRDPYVITLENCRLDVRTGATSAFSPDRVEFCRLPVRYEPGTQCPELDAMVDRVFCHDQELVRLFFEMVGYCLIGHARYHKAFLLYGGGSNGKSVILHMLRRFLGEGNYSTMGIDEVTSRFGTAELDHKLANLGDDINDATIRNTGVLKKLFSGDQLQVERKNERPFTMTPTAKHIYSCNALPRSLDKSAGFYRRLVIVPFAATFRRTDPDFDPMVEDKVTTPAAMSRLLDRALEGAQRLMAQGGFTEPSCVDDLLASYETDNSTVLSWIDDDGVTEAVVTAKPRDDVYADFTAWCRTAGIRPSMVTSRKGFYREVAQHFGLDPKPVQRADGKRWFRKR